MIINLLATFARNYSTHDTRLTVVRNVDKAFKQTTVTSFIHKSKQRGTERKIVIAGTATANDIIEGLKHPRSYKLRLLASIIFTGSKDGEMESLLNEIIQRQIEVFRYDMIRYSTQRHVWNRIHKKGQKLAKPSFYDSGRITEMRNLIQYNSDDHDLVI